MQYLLVHRSSDPYDIMKNVRSILFAYGNLTNFAIIRWIKRIESKFRHYSWLGRTNHSHALFIIEFIDITHDKRSLLQFVMGEGKI